MHDTSTVGLAITGAYLFLMALFLLLSLGLGLLASARAKGTRYAGPVLVTVATPAAVGTGFGFSGHIGWSLVLSAAAIIFSIWWLHNMAKGDL